MLTFRSLVLLAVIATAVFLGTGTPEYEFVGATTRAFLITLR